MWNTCLVFFQAMLLAGYAYAHYSANWLGERRQSLVHLGVLLLPAVVLPLGINRQPGADWRRRPHPGLAVAAAGLGTACRFSPSRHRPAVAALVRQTSHPAAKRPYFLYAASNVGSMLALLGYPSLVEPNLTLAQQRVGLVGRLRRAGAAARLCCASSSACRQRR